MTDVDAELERCGGDQHFELAVAQALLGIEPCFFGEAAVVRGDVFRAQVLGQLMRHALGEPARVDGDEGRAMLFDQLHQALVNLAPHLVRHHRLERRARHLDGEIHLAPVAFVDDRARLLREEARDLLDRLLRRREPDPLQRAAGNVVQTLERERQMRAAARLQYGVDLVDDHDPRRFQHLP